MTEMMRACMEWMMSFGWLGMSLGDLLLAVLIVLPLTWTGQTWPSSRS
jgi:hypothetical protein